MNPSDTLNGHAALPDWGLIRARGEDSRTFLHSQLTQDILTLAPGESRLAGYCSAKGRLLASFVVWLDGDDLLLACSADLLPATLKRLQMFVLRAKCKLSDATAELPLHGLAGDAVQAAAAQRAIVRLPDGWGLPRALCVGEPPAGPALDAELWRWLEVHSGVARIVGATVEHFVPQMVNLELVGGVNFQKGCYPGQEIVARSQYRGTLKRRAYVVQSEAALHAGQEIYSPTDPAQPVGEVVLAAAPAGRTPVALVELKIAASTGPLFAGPAAGSATGSATGSAAGSATGPALQLSALPYSFPAEVA